VAPLENGIDWLHWLLLPPTALIVVSWLTVAAAWAVWSADRGEPAQLDRQAFAMSWREAMARSLFFLGRPWFAWGGGPVPSTAGVAQRRLPPVLLVPGLDAGRVSMIALATFLRRRGWPWAWVVSRAGREQPLADSTEAFHEQVLLLRQASAAPQVDIVAFGTGGLVAAWYIKHHPDAPVRRLVTIGTPWRGTRIAVFQRGRAAREVLPGNHLLDGLAPPRVPTFCVWSPHDPIVVPTSSAVPEEGVQSVRIEGAGHLEMLLSPRVFRAVQAALEQAAQSEVPQNEEGAA